MRLLVAAITSVGVKLIKSNSRKEDKNKTELEQEQWSSSELPLRGWGKLPSSDPFT